MAERFFEAAESRPEMAGAFLMQAEMAEDGCVLGTVHPFSGGEDMSYAGLDQALLLMNRCLDEQDPQPVGMTLRTFRTGRGLRSSAGGAGCTRYPGSIRRGAARRKEAFLVRVICRQHSSWQGEVCWNAQRLCFRSTLELMCLIHSVFEPGVSRTFAGSVERPVFRAV